MALITVYSDLYRTYNEPCDKLVKAVSDYVDAYKMIIEAIYSKNSLVVVVQNRYCLNALTIMSERYSEFIVLELNSPKKRLEEKIGLPIPQYITEDDIIKDGLSKDAEKISFNKSMSFEDNLLSYYLSNLFTHKQVPFNHIVDLSKILVNELENNLAKYEVLKKIYLKKIKDWKEELRDDSQRNVFNELINSPKLLLETLSKYSILRQYPKELRTDIVGGRAKDLEKLGIKPEPFIADTMSIIQIQGNIKIYLNRIDTLGLEKVDVVSYLQRLSGLFIEELEFAYDLLRNNKKILDSSILQLVRMKFKGGLQLDLLFNEKINNIIPPKKVENPEKLDNIDEWINWARNSYLPYKFWMEHNDVVSSEVDQYAVLFGEWIFSHYDSMLSSEERMIFRTIANISTELKEDELSFIVMIDNFNYKYVQFCKEYMASKGYSTTLNQPIIGMIPTETSVSKTAFFNGQAFNTQNKRYDTMCKEWEDLLGCSIKYLSDIGKLDIVEDKPANVYVLNYLSIDRILHESQNNAALPITLQIQKELEAMMDKVLSFGKRLGLETQMKIYFTSDHGSTKISKEQMNLIDAKYYKAKADDHAYRVIALNDNKYNTYKDNIGHLCYVMDREHYGTKENYLIAKGYNRFMETDSSFFVHGGVTPEEIIIPLLKFERVHVDFLPLDILLRDKELRYSILTSINFTIKNYNAYAVKQLKIEIINTNIQWEQGMCVIPDIPGESQQNVALDNIRILKGDNDKILKVKIHFKYLDLDYVKTYDYPIKMKSTQESKFNLDDLL